MEEFIEAVKAWPVIIQGALGSALFWLFSAVGQWLTDKANKSTSSFLKKTRKSSLINERMRLKALKAQGRDQVLYASVLIYRMSRPLLIGLIWMVLGLTFNSIIGVFSIIGYLGSLYYLFIALGIVKAINYEGDIDARIKEIEETLEDMKNA
ncbi:hypothetical protein [Leucothrix pacifica]|uniref:Uncharacterized protein n=1 Tax=Leucothrix pacifica TaxID=1247513 RepID=A0A317C2L9_9GAMM|nr:hypothetical protein [Leucothrix pacifica]PWQ92431.1 hypothetical protein DKW60_21280 [Leucothrix pacifica]